MSTQSSGAPGIADRLRPFGTTIFTEMTLLAQKHGAVNLAQGFPDFDGPAFVKDAAIRAILDGQNQYSRMFGIPALNKAIAASWQARTGEVIDPETEVTVTSGCTEAIAGALLGLVNPGDEVILFEPYYDSYRACVAMAGAVPRFVTLRPPETAAGDVSGGSRSGQFWFDSTELEGAFTSRTRAVLVNTPHNPTGKVFTRAELESIARLCVEHDALALVDEVYERLVYEPALPHVRLATLPGMAARTVTMSSLGKTFSLTGWKIGWAVGAAPLTKGVRAAHQFLTFATATGLQHGAAAALGSDAGEAYVAELLEHYRGARQYLCEALDRLGFTVYRPAGTYFIMAGWEGSRLADGTMQGRKSAKGAAPAPHIKDDVEFCRFLTSEVGVGAIPPSAFYEHQELGRSLVRFAFCKKMETLEKAVERMERWVEGATRAPARSSRSSRPSR